MQKKAEQLRDEAKAAFEKAQAIAKRAEDEGRDFTDDEMVEAKAAIDEGKRLKGEYEKVKASETMRQALVELGDGVPGGEGNAKAALHPRVKAAGGSTWASRAIEKYGAVLAKSIVPDGAVLVNVPLQPEPVRLDVPVLTLRQLIPNVQNASGRFSYWRQTGRTNNAAVVAKGAKKPESDYPTERIDGRTSTIAHISSPVARQDLDDIGMLRQFIDQELRLGLELALEDEVMNGDGTGEHFTGLANVSGSQAQAFSTNLLTTTRKAVTKLERYGYLAGAGWLMTPEDWEAIELLQDNEAVYYYGGPQSVVSPGNRRLWGVPVVVTDAATTGTAYLADFSQMRLHIRQEGTLDWSENIYRANALGAGVGASDFERNLIAFRFEGRFGLEIQRPSAIVEVDLTA